MFIWNICNINCAKIRKARFWADTVKFRNTNLEQSIKKCDWAITGSGLSKHEYLGIKYSKNNRKFVVTFLDHWIHYKLRFIRGNIIQYPDEIWVGDIYAYKMALELFEDIPIIYQENMYIENISGSELVLDYNDIQDAKIIN